MGCSTDEASGACSVDEQKREQREQRTTAAGRSPRGASPFVDRLYDVLEEARAPRMLSWSKRHHGCAFVVHAPEEFSAEVMPAMFRISSFGEFERTLESYGFSKIKYSAGWCFAHPYFAAGKPKYLHRVRKTNGFHPRLPDCWEQARCCNDNGDAELLADLRREVAELREQGAQLATTVQQLQGALLQSQFRTIRTESLIRVLDNSLPPASGRAVPPVLCRSQQLDQEHHGI
eukprot:m51a1_g2189 hypothetical protein (232) ;mRNA; f:122548-123530